MGTYHGLTIRGDSASCPLAFGLDTYYGCEYDCAYCSFLGLHATWSRGEFRVIDLEWLEKTLVSGLKNDKPVSSLACAIRGRKTVRFGNKYDPFQPAAEREHRAGLLAMRLLFSLGFELKLESKNTAAMLEYDDEIQRGRAIVTTTVMIGMDADWELFEGRRTPSPEDRLAALTHFAKTKQVAVTTEPFIPGYHTVGQFRDFVLRLKAAGIRRTNVYNMRLVPYNVKRLIEIGVDAERVWEMNQDNQWRPVLLKLLEIGRDEDVIIGCPDFVNSGVYVEKSNTCCGVDAVAPCTFNWINWKQLGLKAGRVGMGEVGATWDGVGDFSQTMYDFMGRNPKSYTLGDTGVFRLEGKEWKRN